MKNAKWINKERTAVDLYINHQQYGWLPFTALKDDPSTSEIFARVVSGEAGQIAEYTEPTSLTDEQVQAAIDIAVTDWIDAQAKSAGFKNASYIASYINSTNPAWKATALSFISWRDGIWATCIGIINNAKANKRTFPTAEDILTQLLPFRA